MARSSILGLFEVLNSANIVVHQTRCAVVRNKNATCMKCAQACTSGCISYDDNELIISPDLCVGCGTCATVCPTCALEAHHPSDGELYGACKEAAAAADGKLVISCEQIAAAARKHLDATRVAQVVCLGRVEESLLVRLAADGVEQIVLVSGPCETCEHKVGLKTAKLVCQTTKTLLETWNNTCNVRLSDKFPSFVRLTERLAYDASKRAFFDTAGKDAKLVATHAANEKVREVLGETDEESENAPESRYLKVMADGTLPHFIPDRRERLLDSLARLGDPNPGYIETRLWGHVSIDVTLCTSCRMCATFCPTGAIVKFDEEDGTFGIEHRAGDCVKCRCCTDICPKGALVLEDVVDARAISEGTVERHVLPPRSKEPSGPHAILNYMRDLFEDTDQIYER